MTDFPQSPIAPLFIHTWSRWSALFNIEPSGAETGVSLTWPVASTAFYIPVSIPFPYLVKRVFWINGSSVTTTNMDMGIYTDAGTKIYSTGSTAAAGVSATQYVTPSPDFVLYPGSYYFALADDSITANRGGHGTTTVLNTIDCRLAGILQQATALPLPATMTPASVANVCVPIFGVTRTASGF